MDPAENGRRPGLYESPAEPPRIRRVDTQVDEAAKTELHPEALISRLLLCTPPASDGSRWIARIAENTGNILGLR
jgi:hypothetical protein